MRTRRRRAPGRQAARNRPRESLRTVGAAPRLPHRALEEQRRPTMPQTITRGYKALVDEANAKIETVPAADAVGMFGRDDVVFVDLRDPRELEREGKVPGA